MWGGAKLGVGHSVPRTVFRNPPVDSGNGFGGRSSEGPGSVSDTHGRLGSSQETRRVSAKLYRPVPKPSSPCQAVRVRANPRCQAFLPPLSGAHWRGHQIASLLSGLLHYRQEHWPAIPQPPSSRTPHPTSVSSGSFQLAFWLSFYPHV